MVYTDADYCENIDLVLVIHLINKNIATFHFLLQILQDYIRYTLTSAGFLADRLFVKKYDWIYLKNIDNLWHYQL